MLNTYTRIAASVFVVCSLCSHADAQLTAFELGEALKPSVVRIEVTGTRGGDNVGQIAKVVGTGVIVTDSGYVITAKHLLRDSDGSKFVGLPEVKVYLSGDLYRSRPLNVSIDGIVEDSVVDAALLKLKESDTVRYTPATWCQNGDPDYSQLVAIGYPGELELVVRSGPLDSKDGLHHYWQTGIPTALGMSGGPVVTNRAEVVGIVYGGAQITASGRPDRTVPDAASLVVPSYRLLNLLNSAGVQPLACTKASRLVSPMIRNDSNRITKLYAPLYAEITSGSANFQVFRENFNTRFGRYSPVRYYNIAEGGDPVRKPVPLSDAEWKYWMEWVERYFLAENRAIAALIKSRSYLLVGGVMTPCLKSLLVHLAAFEDSYRQAKANPDQRIWQPDHGWPTCIEQEVEGTLSRLSAAAVQSTRDPS